MQKRTLFVFLLFVMIISSCNPASQPAVTATPPLPETPNSLPSQPASLYIRFDSPVTGEGITLLQSQEDNQYVTVRKEDQDALSTDGFTSQVRTNYIYFKVDDGFPVDQGPVTIEFEYYDEGQGLIIFEYDSSSKDHPEPAYKSVSAGFLQNTLQWKKESLVLADARFSHRQNFGADFRFAAESTPLIVRQIRIILVGRIAAAPTPLPTVFPPATYPTPLGEKAVFSYYFYWYDPLDHIFNMTNAAVDYKTMSWGDVNWHIRQVKDVAETGIDVILPIYWYSPYELHWSQPGIEKLAEALEITRTQGVTPPAVGLFMDTTSSQGKDLRLEIEQAYVYSHIKFFFITIPREYWALAEDSRPIVWFYTANWPAAYDQSFMDYLYLHFEEDFGVRPYLVFENGWDYPTETIGGAQVKNYNAAHLNYDAGYAWGGAVSPIISPQIASIGPGYDDHAVDDRIPPTITDRKNGETYKQSFAVAIQCGTPWLAIETWNEYHEGTEISESLQYGRQFIDLSKEYVAYFKQGSLPEGAQPNISGEEIFFFASEPNQAGGLSIGPSLGDGLFFTVDISGTPAISTTPMTPEAEASYLYFQVDNGFYFNQPRPVTLSITYFDEGYQPVSIDYDTAQCGSTFNAGKMYRRIDLATRGNTLTWKTAKIQISNATFAGNQNGGADFRLATGTSPLIINEVRIGNVR
jgi:hypothetical protein